MATFKNATAYINTDLEMWSRSDIGELAKYFDEHAAVLSNLWHEGRNLVCVEAACGSECLIDGDEAEERDQSVGAAEGTIKELLDLVERLPADLRSKWDQCDERLFDMGYNSHDTEKRSHRTDLSLETISRLERANGTLRITLYPLSMQEIVDHRNEDGDPEV